jgi:hypothetical protein
LGSAGQVTPVQESGVDELARDDPPAPDEERIVVPPDGIPAPPVLLLAVAPPVFVLAITPPLAPALAMGVAPPLGREELLREEVIEAPPEGIADAPPEGIAVVPPEEIGLALAPPVAPAVLALPAEGTAGSLSSISVGIMSERIPHPANSKVTMDATRREKVLLGMVVVAFSLAWGDYCAGCVQGTPLMSQL